MSVTVETRAAKAINVGMAQIAVLLPGETAKSVLGSCVGLVLYHAAKKKAAVAHIVLPQSHDRSGPPGKFADTAIPEMLRLLAEHRVGKAGLIAKIAGGANMFGGSGPLQIGDANVLAVTKILETLNITIVGRHIGGEQGRRITMDSKSGDFTIEVAKQEPIIL